MSGGRQQARILSRIDEMVRRNQALLRMLPAQQGLESSDLSRRKLHDGLVVHAELCCSMASRSSASSFRRFTARVCMASSNNFATGPSESFGAAHGNVGILQQIFGAGMRRASHGDTHAGRCAHFAAFHQKRLRHRRKNALARPASRRSDRSRLPKDGEFISAHSGENGISRSDLVLRARNRVFVSKTGFDAMANLDNHLIAQPRGPWCR